MNPKSCSQDQRQYPSTIKISSQGSPRAERLVAALKTLIPMHANGIDWVCWLGGESHQNNTQALLAWVDRELLSNPVPKGVAPLTHVMDRLTRRIRLMEASFAE